MNDETRVRESVAFVLWTLCLSWLLWLPLVFSYRAGAVDIGDLAWWVSLCWLAGTWVPSVVGLWMTVAAGGFAAARGLLASSIAQYRRPATWLPALLLPVLIWFATLGAVAATFETEWPSVDLSRWIFIPVAILFAIPFGPLGEEFGWRGYLQPRLLKSLSANTTGMLVGFVWFLWHIPLLWAPAGTSISGEAVTVGAVAGYALSLIALSIFLARAAGPSVGSLFPALVLHTIWNAEPARFLFAPLPESADPQISLYSPIMTVVVTAAAIGLVRVFWSRER